MNRDREERSSRPVAAPSLSPTGPGQPLDNKTRGKFETQLHAPLGHVRIHRGEESSLAAGAVSADAFTIGPDIVFGRGKYSPETADGGGLLAHELAHVVQQNRPLRQTNYGARLGPADAEEEARNVSSSLRRSDRSPFAGRDGTRPSRPRGGHIIQRAIRPEDVASEMVGRSFTLTTPVIVAALGTLPVGTVVTVITWSNSSQSITASSPLGPAVIPKTSIIPTATAVSGVDPYSAAVPGQATAVARNEAQLSTWMAGRAAFKTREAVARFEAERARLEVLLARRRAALNRKLIQETMFNRFDAIIKAEVDAANAAHGLRGTAALDPNLLKSMLFQESQLGTSGTHLEVPPSHPTKTRFNVGQVIDSSGMALLTVIEREHPTIAATHGLATLRSDLAAAQTERRTLRAKASRTAPEVTRLAELDVLAQQSWETFIWRYKRPGSPTGFADAVSELFAGPTPRNEDYQFWIHMAVLWLFEKRGRGRTWPEAIRAYNGGGARASNYRDAVTGRASGARAAARSSQPFVPGNI